MVKLVIMIHRIFMFDDVINNYQRDIFLNKKALEKEIHKVFVVTTNLKSFKYEY